MTVTVTDAVPSHNYPAHEQAKCPMRGPSESDDPTPAARVTGTVTVTRTVAWAA